MTRRFTISASATTFSDSPPLPLVTYCYQLLAVDRSGNTLGDSDVLCVRPGTRVGSAPANFAARLDQSSIARLSWDGVNGATSYVLLEETLSAAPHVVTLSASSRSTTDVTNGAPTCYVLFAMRGLIPIGRTDTTCVVPGQSQFGSTQGVQATETRLNAATRELDRPREFLTPP